MDVAAQGLRRDVIHRQKAGHDGQVFGLKQGQRALACAPVIARDRR
jgi:hypothetical protein